MPSDTKQRLMDAAFLRLYNNGFRNVSIDQILGDVGISKTAFYKHFESKDDLLLAALEHRHAQLEDEIRTVIRRRGGECPIAQMRALFDVVQTISDEEWFRGCVFVNVAIEFPQPHEPAHAVAVKSKLAIQALVAELAHNAGAREPVALAEELCMIMEGAYVTRQVTRSPHAVSIARRLANRTIDSHLGEQAAAILAASPPAPEAVR